MGASAALGGTESGGGGDDDGDDDDDAEFLFAAVLRLPAAPFGEPMVQRSLQALVGTAFAAAPLCALARVFAAPHHRCRREEERRRPSDTPIAAGPS